MALVAVALAFFVISGCGAPANEENLTVNTSAAPPKESLPKFNTQAEYELYRAEQAKKNQPSRKKKAKSASGGRPHG